MTRTQADHIRGMAGLSMLGLRNLKHAADGPIMIDASMVASLINTLDGLLNVIDDLQADKTLLSLVVRASKA